MRRQATFWRVAVLLLALSASNSLARDLRGGLNHNGAEGGSNPVDLGTSTGLLGNVLGGSGNVRDRGGASNGVPLLGNILGSGSNRPLAPGFIDGNIPANSALAQKADSEYRGTTGVTDGIPILGNFLSGGAIDPDAPVPSPVTNANGVRILDTRAQGPVTGLTMPLGGAQGRVNGIGVDRNGMQVSVNTGLVGHGLGVGAYRQEGGRGHDKVNGMQVTNNVNLANQNILDHRLAVGIQRNDANGRGRGVEVVNDVDALGIPVRHSVESGYIRDARTGRISGGHVGNKLNVAGLDTVQDVHYGLTTGEDSKFDTAQVGATIGVAGVPVAHALRVGLDKDQHGNANGLKVGNNVDVAGLNIGHGVQMGVTRDHNGNVNAIKAGNSVNLGPLRIGHGLEMGGNGIRPEIEIGFGNNGIKLGGDNGLLGNVARGRGKPNAGGHGDVVPGLGGILGGNRPAAGSPRPAGGAAGLPRVPILGGVTGHSNALPFLGAGKGNVVPILGGQSGGDPDTGVLGVDVERTRGASNASPRQQPGRRNRYKSLKVQGVRVQRSSPRPVQANVQTTHQTTTDSNGYSAQYAGGN